MAAGIALCSFASAPASGQEVPAFYVHVGGAVAGEILSSEVISALVPDYDVKYTISYALLARAGLGQVVQGEYRQGKGDHDLRLTGFFRGTIGVVDERRMDYEFSEWTVKFNPAFSEKRQFPAYLVAGQSEVDYLNEQGEGFRGSGTVLGIEFVGVTRNLSVTFGVKRHGLSFDPVSLDFFGAPVQQDVSIGAANWVIDFTIAAGMGT